MANGDIKEVSKTPFFFSVSACLLRKQVRPPKFG